jgi:hypothetical protein
MTARPPAPRHEPFNANPPVSAPSPTSAMADAFLAAEFFRAAQCRARRNRRRGGAGVEGVMLAFVPLGKAGDTVF